MIKTKNNIRESDKMMKTKNNIRKTKRECKIMKEQRIT